MLIAEFDHEQSWKSFTVCDTSRWSSQRMTRRRAVRLRPEG